MIGFIIAIVVLIVAIGLHAYIEGKDSKMTTAIVFACIVIVIFTLVAVELKREKYGVKFPSNPDITYKVINEMKNGEVVKSDTIFTVKKRSR